MTKYFSLLSVIILLSGLSACNNSDYAPLPKAYFRIDLPNKEYKKFDSVFPYRFQYPVYAQVVADTRPTAEPFWADVQFPQFKAALHLSYKPINANTGLNTYVEDSRNFLNRHIPKASGFSESVYTNPETHVYGVIFEIDGKDAATPIQFYLTDSTSHFLRGALYFNVSPNNDSLAPVIDFLKEDIRLMMETITWN